MILLGVVGIPIAERGDLWERVLLEAVLGREFGGTDRSRFLVERILRSSNDGQR